MLLLNASSKSKGALWERERATRLCEMATQRWNGKIKGFIRMKAGFEAIMCSFSDSLDFVGSTRAGPFAAKGGISGGKPDSDNRKRYWPV